MGSFCHCQAWREKGRQWPDLGETSSPRKRPPLRTHCQQEEAEEEDRGNKSQVFSLFQFSICRLPHAAANPTKRQRSNGDWLRQPTEISLSFGGQRTGWKQVENGFGGVNKRNPKHKAFFFLKFQGKQHIPNDKSSIYLHKTENDQGLQPFIGPPRLLNIGWGDNTTWLTSEVGWSQTTLVLTQLLERKLQQQVLLLSSDAAGECSLWKNEDSSTRHREQVTPASTSHLNV